MQKIKFFIFFTLISILYGCSNNHLTNLNNWVGNYYYDEKPVKANAGYYMTMEWTLSINRKNDSFPGILEINGQQTYIKLLTDIIGDSNRIFVVYHNLVEGSDENLKKGDTLFVLSMDKTAIKTTWNRLTPRLLDSFSNERNYFIRSNPKSSPSSSNMSVNQDIDTSSGCIRGPAEPIINSVIYPNTTFQLQQDHITGLEYVNFDNGDKLIIKNWGCEYYILTFRFETNRFQENITDSSFWIEKAPLLIRELYKGLKAPIDIEAENENVINYIGKHPKVQFGEEIELNSNEIRTFATIDKIEALSDKNFAIEISFTKGPL